MIRQFGDNSPKPVPMTSRRRDVRSLSFVIIPVVPHKAVAEVSKIGNL